MKKNKIWLATLEGTFREIEITEEELPRALWNFTHNINGIYQGGAGKIKALAPDYVQSMDWNKGHRPTPEDWEDIRKELGRSMENTVSSLKLLISKSKTLEELEKRKSAFLLPDGKLKLPEKQDTGQKMITSGIGDYK